MGRIVEFFLNRPMLVNLIIIVVIILGINSAYQAKKEGFPEISLNKIIIETIYPGASSADVELNITVPIEDALHEVEGIKEVLSVSQEGISRIEVQADDNASEDEFKKLYMDVDAAVTELEDLPGDIDGRPSINEFTSSDIPVLEIAYMGKYPVLKPYIDGLEARLKKIPEVAQVNVIGLPDEEVQILVDPVKARNNLADLRMIASAIQKRNIEGSGGTLESFMGEKKVVFMTKFEKYRDVLNTNVIMNQDGYGVKLKQMAKLSLQPQEVNLIVRNNGSRGAVLTVKKSSSSDIIKVSDKINTLLKNEQLPDGIEHRVLFDQSEFTRNRISLLIGNALIGFILVVSLLLIIFDMKTAIWTAFGIPFSLFGMLIFLKLYGLSLNLISLGGFVIIIGMLVDDAIVIAEEISKNKENGMDSGAAAVAAVKKMWTPVLAASLTTMVAFSPIFFVGGFPGKFIWAIPLMVIVGLIISLFESFFILPAHLTHGREKKIEKKAFVVRLEHIYRKLLIKVIKFKYPVLLLFILLFFGSLFTLKNFIKKDPFPQDAAEGFNIALTLPRGTPLEITEKNIEAVERILLSLPENEIIGISTRIGTQSELVTADRGSQHNIGIIFVYLKPASGRERTANRIMTALRGELNEILLPREIEFSMNLKRLGPPMGRPFEIRIISNDEGIRNQKEQEIRTFLESVEGISEIENDIIEGKDELNLQINHDILARTGLTVADVLTTLRIAFDGMIVTDMVTIDKQVDFRLRLNQKARGDMNFIASLPIVNSFGNMINLKEFVSLRQQPSKAEVRHIDGVRSVTLFGNTDIRKTSPVEVMNRVQARFKSDKNCTIAFAGQPEETKNIFADLSSAALMALLGIYLLISLIFNSYLRPLIIMLTLPFMVIGLAFVLVTHGLPLSMMAGVAMVGLLGVVVNDSIVMVHTIHDVSPEDKVSRDNIIEGAVSRLRPVLLTTITTICGVLPTGYGIGGYDPFLSHMSVVLAYGLLFGTASILLMVPIMFNIGLDIKSIAARLFSRRRVSA